MRLFRNGDKDLGEETTCLLEYLTWMLSRLPLHPSSANRGRLNALVFTRAWVKNVLSLTSFPSRAL